MAEKKKSLLDFGMQFLRQILAERPAEAPTPATATKATLDDITLDELKHEKVRLDQEERTMIIELRKLEAEKQELFKEGVRNPSELEQRVIARRIKGLDAKSHNLDSMLKSISKQAQIIDGLVQIKDRARLTKESGLTGIIGTLDLDELVTYIRTASVDGEFQINKFDEILDRMGIADKLSPQISEDKDVMDIVRQMQLAREAADSPEALKEHYSQMNQDLAAKTREKDLEAPEEEY